MRRTAHLIALLVASGRPPTISDGPVLYLKHLLTPYTAAEKQGLERTQWFSNKGQLNPLLDGVPVVLLTTFAFAGFGYFQEQSTKPQTLGYSLADSPAGLLAWIYEKLVTWTDEYPWGDDEGQSLPPTALVSWTVC